ncbi:hypothetical protein NHX12_012608 [Muraenolepis orangiensis]|uniref:Uncharacterized protein n=1 Tax=Muraenolepis orangiensis TaxID=630683 RepID=A0A9Q0DCZ2_9TELE|nr:hypothetical protein NHX12_012608 [Muraenolepis orangiensis]
MAYHTERAPRARCPFAYCQILQSDAVRCDHGEGTASDPWLIGMCLLGTGTVTPLRITGNLGKGSVLG